MNAAEARPCSRASGRAREPARSSAVHLPRLASELPHGCSPAAVPYATIMPSTIRDNDAMRVLVVEDDPKMAALLRQGLREEGDVVDVTDHGEDALWQAETVDYDVIVLDVLLPGVDGFEVCRRLRQAKVWTPVLMLTAKDAVEDRVAGLDTGADDYLTKPFSFAELAARLRALDRRGTVSRPTVLEVGELRLDPATRQVWRAATEIDLSSKEFALLATLMARPGQVLSRLQLLERAWDLGYDPQSNVVDVYVRRLRDKLDRPFGVCSIETLRGVGYRLRKDGGRR